MRMVSTRGSARVRYGVGCWLAVALATLSACHSDVADPPEQDGAGSTDAALVGTNALTPNGIATNGIATNGIATNGLSTAGLSTTAFATWFNSNPASLSNMVMSYVIRCALPATGSRTWTNPSTLVQYTWVGGLGLAPTWASGQPPTEVEEQLITACLAALVNKYGVQMLVSVQGQDSQGTALPTTLGELQTYTRREGAFFGNLFRGEGVFVCNDSLLSLAATQSTLRGCSFPLQGSGLSANCPPIEIVGYCHAAQTCTLDSTGAYYQTCTHGGKTYRPLTTHIRPDDIYTCGDGTCQLTESCGTGQTAESCKSDCGTCVP